MERVVTSTKQRTIVRCISSNPVLIFVEVLVWLVCPQRKSREESHGTESGVEIIENKPYSNGPGGNGQYTYKIYHIGSHLPGTSLYIT